VRTRLKPHIPRGIEEKTTRLIILNELAQRDVRIIDPETTFVEDTATIETGVILWPHVYILGNSVIQKGVEVKPETVIRNSQVGEHTMVESFSFISDSWIKKNCVIGPFAHIHKRSVIEERAEIGKAEIVRSHIGSGTLIKHESYVGDAEIGRHCNIGADSDVRSRPRAGKRTVVCNYDGRRKHKTVIEDNVFVGSGTKIIAPRRIGAKAFIAAGSLVTQDVPRGDIYGCLVISRSGKQIIKPNRVKRDQNGWTILK